MEYAKIKAHKNHMKQIQIYPKLNYSVDIPPSIKIQVLENIEFATFAIETIWQANMYID